MRLPAQVCHLPAECDIISRAVHAAEGVARDSSRSGFKGSHDHARIKATGQRNPGRRRTQNRLPDCLFEARAKIFEKFFFRRRWKLFEVCSGEVAAALFGVRRTGVRRESTMLPASSTSMPA